MKDKELQIGLENIRKISMTTLEKERLFESIIGSYPIPKKSVPSPWNLFSFTFKTQNRFVYYGVVPALIVILFGSCTVFASQNSLPGDILYPIKVGVVEPIRGDLISSPENKAKYQASLATERLTEAETLASQGKLDTPKQQEINKVLVNNISSFNKDIATLHQSNGEDVDNLVTDLEANINAHAQILEIINSYRHDSKQNEDSQISKTVIDNAGIVRNNLKNYNSNNPNKYSKDKNQIQSIIDSTSTLLDQTANDGSVTGQTIFSDTKETLDQARQLLNKADNQNNYGDPNSAYSSLLDSEIAAKQANVFLQSELKFKKNNNNGKEGRRQ